MSELSRKALARTALLLLALPLWALLTGLGGGKGLGSVTSPSEEHRAVLTDADGASMQVEAVNIAGEVALVGRLGRGDLRIPFATIASIEITDEPGDFASARVTLSDGKDVTVLVRDSLSFYGTTAAGLFQIRARDLLRISIEH